MLSSRHAVVLSLPPPPLLERSRLHHNLHSGCHRPALSFQAKIRQGARDALRAGEQLSALPSHTRPQVKGGTKSLPGRNQVHPPLGEGHAVLDLEAAHCDVHNNSS